MKPKSFAEILASMIESQLYSTSVKDLQSSSVMAGISEQLNNTPERKLIRFLARLDTRFKKYL